MCHGPSRQVVWVKRSQCVLVVVNTCIKCCSLVIRSPKTHVNTMSEQGQCVLVRYYFKPVTIKVEKELELKDFWLVLSGGLRAVGFIALLYMSTLLNGMSPGWQQANADIIPTGSKDFSIFDPSVIPFCSVHVCEGLSYCIIYRNTFSAYGTECEAMHPCTTATFHKGNNAKEPRW